MSVTGINLNIKDHFSRQIPEFNISYDPSQQPDYMTGQTSDYEYSDYYKKFSKKPNVFQKMKNNHKNMTPEDKAEFNASGQQFGQMALSGLDAAIDAGVFGKAEGGEGVTNVTKFISSIKTGNPYIDGATKILDTGANLLNVAFARKLPTFQADQDIMSKATGYSGAANEINEAMDNSGKNIGLFGHYNKMKRQLESARERFNKVSKIVTTADDRNSIATGNLDLQNLNTKLKQDGTDFLSHSLTNFKDGGKFEIEEIPHWEFVEVSDIESFKNGGEFNVIPDGSLHARKHNLDIDGITKKGIPVVSEEDGGIVQHAEIERDEIILRKSVTEKLEKWKDTFYNEESKKKDKDEACLKAGKLLVNEILNNTQDNTGLLNGIQ